MQKTSNYNLNQWEPTDPIRREDFNADNAAIDAALASGTRIATGSYVGSGVYGTSNRNTLTFDFAPKIVFIFRKNYYGPLADTQSTGSCCGIQCQVFFAGGSVFGVFDSKTDVVRYEISETTLNWYTDISAAAQMNTTNMVYAYIAIG